MRLLVAGLVRVAVGNGSALPTFAACGDWSAVETPRAKITKGTGPAAAGANFLLALEARVDMALALGEHAEAAAHTAELDRLRAVFDRLRAVFDAEFWNSSTGTCASRAIESQTLSSLGLAAGAPQNAGRRIAVAATLKDDIAARRNHLTSGSAGRSGCCASCQQAGRTTARSLPRQASTEPKRQ